MLQLQQSCRQPFATFKDLLYCNSVAARISALFIVSLHGASVILQVRPIRPEEAEEEEEQPRTEGRLPWQNVTS